MTVDTQEGSEASDAIPESVHQQLRRHGVKLGWGGVAPWVFWPALGIILLVCVLAMAFPGPVGDALASLQGGIVSTFGWYYTLVVAAFVGFSVWIALSKFGRIKLGREGDEPEFSMGAWFAMLFAAGMGIGLVFYGVAEPLTFATTEPKPGVTGTDIDLAQQAMAQTFLHWGLHPWAIYVVIGLSLAYAIHRKGRPVSIRWALEPLFGDRVKGRMGDVIDVLAIIGTLFGVATSLGLGVQQIAAGLSHLGLINEPKTWVLVVLILIITALATTSVVSGVGAGIKWLSNINLTMAGVLLIAVLILGPTLFLLRNFVESLGVYLMDVLPMTFDTSAYTGAQGQAWQSKWSIFYWGWWMSWAPFVGVFIARISRGRTVRQFVAGALLVPTLVAFFWFSILGGTAIYREVVRDQTFVEGGEIVAENVLFDMLNGLPFGAILSVIAILLVAIFFITSSDSGSLVVDMLASGGHPDPPTWSRVVWAVLEGLVAIGLLLAGGLAALQAGAIATALPFSIIMVLMAIALYRALSKESRILEEEEARHRQHRFTQRLTGDLTENFDETFGPKVDDRIDYALNRTRGRKSRRGADPGEHPGDLR